ncbi:hypothetical protein [Paeniglutamicibacter antarcticus]|uniref:hypothetical protein n=1 Tax=Paeniglutamicibacter antarcticus TaxID=494023 RepID=UPI0031EA4D3B
MGSELPDHRYLFLSDTLPTVWQGVDYANVPESGTLAVFGSGPVVQRPDMAARHGVEVLGFPIDIVAELQEMTKRGPDSIFDAVGLKAHGSTGEKLVQAAAGLLPKKLGQQAMETILVDQTSVLHTTFAAVRRGGTVSLSGLHAGAATPMAFIDISDKQIQLREGQRNTRSWTQRILPFTEDPSDPPGLDDLVAHTAPSS